MMAHVACVSEPAHRKTKAATRDDLRAGLGEHVHALVHGEQRAGDTRTLVIARHDKHGAALIGNQAKRSECVVHGAGADVGVIEDVPAMHDRVDLPSQCWLERFQVARQEVFAASSPIHASALH